MISATSSTPATPVRFLLKDELTVQTRQAFKQQVLDALAEGALHVVVDASHCGYIDSSGLGVFVSLHKKCREAGGSFTIEGLKPDMRTWMTFVKLDTLLTFEPPITDAERAGG